MAVAKLDKYAGCADRDKNVLNSLFAYSRTLQQTMHPGSDSDVQISDKLQAYCDDNSIFPHIFGVFFCVFLVLKFWCIDADARSQLVNFNTKNILKF